MTRKTSKELEIENARLLSCGYTNDLGEHRHNLSLRYLRVSIGL